MAKDECRDDTCIFCGVTRDILAELDTLTREDDRFTCVRYAVESTFDAGVRYAQAKAILDARAGGTLPGGRFVN